MTCSTALLQGEQRDDKQLVSTTYKYDAVAIRQLDRLSQPVLILSLTTDTVKPVKGKVGGKAISVL